MKRTLIPIVILFSLLLVNSFSQETGRLRGFITDSTNGEFLPYANVYIPTVNIGASTDERGLYLLNLISAPGEYEVVFSYVGYEPKKIFVKIVPGKITELDVTLAPINIELEGIEKIGEKVFEQNQTDIGLERITIRKLQALPSSVESDLFRSLQTIAGVQSTSDISAKYYVRGGSGDQNLVLLNGAAIYNPFHALGLFSVIDPELINSVEFYKSNFTAEYGGRVSSVISILSRDGNRKYFSGSASASFLSGKAVVEGPIPDGSFIITGRKSLSSKILDDFYNDQNIPLDFYDVFAKVNYEAPIFGRLHVYGFFSKDKIDDPDLQRNDYEWTNNIIGMELVQVYDAPIFSRIGISKSVFEGNIESSNPDFRPLKNRLEDMNIMLDMNYVWENRDELSFGINFKTIRSEVFLQNSSDAVSDLSFFSALFSVYIKYKLLRWDNFGMDVGTHFNILGLTPNGSVVPEPRLNLSYQPFDLVKFKAGVGLYQQEIGAIADEKDVISFFDPWTIYPEYLEPTRALHLSFGAYSKPFENLSLQLEGYYKKINNLVTVNEEKTIDTDPDLVNGTGESYGLEFQIENRYGGLTSTVAYTLSWTYKEVNDWLYYPKYDSRHAVNVGLNYDFGAGWSANLNWSYKSGLPYTPLLGYYDRLQVPDVLQNNPALFNYSPFVIFGDLNTERLPQYHRLDASISKSFDFGFTRIKADVSIINVYDNKNLFYFDRETGNKVYMLPFLPTATIRVEF